jgi:hypothetical protein
MYLMDATIPTSAYQPSVQVSGIAPCRVGVTIGHGSPKIVSSVITRQISEEHYQNGAWVLHYGIPITERLS